MIGKVLKVDRSRVFWLWCTVGGACGRVVVVRTWLRSLECQEDFGIGLVYFGGGIWMNELLDWFRV